MWLLAYGHYQGPAQGIASESYRTSTLPVNRARRITAADRGAGWAVRPRGPAVHEPAPRVDAGAQEQQRREGDGAGVLLQRGLPLQRRGPRPRAHALRHRRRRRRAPALGRRQPRRVHPHAPVRVPASRCCWVGDMLPVSATAVRRCGSCTRDCAAARSGCGERPRAQGACRGVCDWHAYLCCHPRGARPTAAPLHGNPILL